MLRWLWSRGNDAERVRDQQRRARRADRVYDQLSDAVKHLEEAVVKIHEAADRLDHKGGEHDFTS